MEEIQHIFLKFFPALKIHNIIFGMKNTFLDELLSLKNENKAKVLSGFFKTNKGQYGEGDIFLGIPVPSIRAVVKKYFEKLTLDDIDELVKNPFHEVRCAALLSLVSKYNKADDALKKEISDLYLKNTDYINNWDLVDLTAPNILGDYFYNSGKKDTLFQLAKSKNLWQERISIVSTFYFIKKGDFAPTFYLAKNFLSHKHDLIHKASGWMLREAGKRDKKALCTFLDEYAKFMPRTMLRYAIEKFDDNERKKYLAVKKCNLILQ